MRAVFTYMAEWNSLIIQPNVVISWVSWNPENCSEFHRKLLTKADPNPGLLPGPGHFSIPYSPLMHTWALVRLVYFYFLIAITDILELELISWFLYNLPLLWSPSLVFWLLLDWLRFVYHYFPLLYILEKLH